MAGRTAAPPRLGRRCCNGPSYFPWNLVKGRIGRTEHRARLVAIAVLDIDHRGINTLAGNTFQRHGPVAGTAVPVTYLEQVAHHIVVGDLATAILAATD